MQETSACVLISRERSPRNAQLAACRNSPGSHYPVCGNRALQHRPGLAGCVTPGWWSTKWCSLPQNLHPVERRAGGECPGSVPQDLAGLGAWRDAQPQKGLGTAVLWRMGECWLCSELARRASLRLPRLLLIPFAALLITKNTTQ